MKKLFAFTLMLCFAAATAMAQGIGLQPKKEYEMSPDIFGMKFEEHDIPSEDKSTLKAWYFPAPQKSPDLMIISHNGRGNMGDYLELVGQFQSLGFNVLTYDYRGFGASSELNLNSKLYILPQFAQDLNAVCDYAKRNFSLHFSLYGQGFGGGLSIGVGMDRREVKYLIGDSPYSTLEYVKNQYKKVENETIIVPPVFNKNYEPAYALERSDVPRLLEGVMIIVGGADKIFSQEMAKELAAKNKKLVTVKIMPTASFDNTIASNSNEYFSSVRSFLKR